jgi:hypothetical protein
VPPFTPYLAVRAVGNAGLCQPGRVIGGNNFVPLGIPFSGLENTTLSVVNSQSQQRIIQFGNDLYVWQQNAIRQYDPITGIWGNGAGSTTPIHTVSGQDTSGDSGFHTGLHFMHDIDGFPILIGFADPQSGSHTIRIKYGPDSGGIYGWTQLNITASFGNVPEISGKGVAVYHNHLYRSNGPSQILRYDPTTELLAVQNVAAAGQTGDFRVYQDMIVFKDRLFHMGQGTLGYIHELVSGTWHTRRLYTSGNPTVSPSMFEHNGNLYFMYGETSGSEDGWRLYRVDDLDTFSSTNLDSLIPANFRFNSGTERGSPGTAAPNWYITSRSYVVIDQEIDPENPRTLIIIGSANGHTNTMTAFEFVDETAVWTELPGGNLTGEMHYPHNNAGSGAYHWTVDQLNVQITDVRIISNTEEEIDFIAYGDPGVADKIVRIYYDNLQEVPIEPATLISSNPTSGTTIMTGTFGDFVDGVDADNITVYTVVRDFAVDGAAIGQQEVLMPHIERP